MIFRDNVYYTAAIAIVLSKNNVIKIPACELFPPQSYFSWQAWTGRGSDMVDMGMGEPPTLYDTGTCSPLSIDP